MEIVFSSSNSAYAASIAMKYFFFFVFVIEQIANTTKISGKLDLAIFTIFLRRLNMFTNLAANLNYFMSINFMIFFRIHFILIFSYIMAESAWEEFQALRTSFITFSYIMLASINLILPFFFFFFLAKYIF